MTADAPDNDWALDEALGGPDALQALLDDLYTRLYADLMIGFFFAPHDRAALIAHQRDYLMAHLGRRPQRYTGRPLREAHAHLPILPGHFDRRHRLLTQTLDDHHVPPHVRAAWLALDLSVRDLVLRLGARARSAREL
jgi:hemoglobin